MLILASLVCGFIFGLGLLISGMTQPSKVLGFLDIFGAWDPSLAVVMAAALAVSGVGYWLVQQRPQPVLAPKFDIPTKTAIDTPLVAGSALFGIGWGLVGLCPGPALENLATLSPPRDRVLRRDGRRHGRARSMVREAAGGAAERRAGGRGRLTHQRFPGAAQHAVVRCRPGIPVSSRSKVTGVPDQRRTVSLRFTLHRVRDTRPTPAPPPPARRRPRSSRR